MPNFGVAQKFTDSAPLKFRVAFRIRRRIMKSRAEFGAAYQSVPCRIRRRRIMRCRIRRGAAHTKFGVAVQFGAFPRDRIYKT